MTEETELTALTEFAARWFISSDGRRWRAVRRTDQQTVDCGSVPALIVALRECEG